MTETDTTTEENYQDTSWQDEFDLSSVHHPLADTPDPYSDQGMFDGEEHVK